MPRALLVVGSVPKQRYEAIRASNNLDAKYTTPEELFLDDDALFKKYSRGKASKALKTGTPAYTQEVQKLAEKHVEEFSGVIAIFIDEATWKQWNDISNIWVVKALEKLCKDPVVWLAYKNGKNKIVG